MFTCPEPTAVFADFDLHAVWRLSQELAEILKPASGVEPLHFPNFLPSVPQRASMSYYGIFSCMRGAFSSSLFVYGCRCQDQNWGQSSGGLSVPACKYAVGRGANII
jgi:hypothetical protein